MRRFRRYALRWRQISPSERRLLGEAVWRLASARLQMRSTTFQRLAAGLTAPDTTIRKRQDIVPLADSVRRAAGVVPFRALCFEQALALHAMARARGEMVTLHYGLARTDCESLAGHVWVSVGGKVILGNAGRERFEEVAAFPLAGTTDTRSLRPR